MVLSAVTVMWNRDIKLKLLLITLTAMSAFVLLTVHGMRFDFRSAAKAVGTVGLLLPFAVVFNRRGIDSFANLLTGFLCMVAFNLFLSILTYAGTPFARPLADNLLMSADAALGCHVPSMVQWTHEHPMLQKLLNMAYVSVLPSTLLALVVVGLDRDVTRMRRFVLHFILGGLITTVVFFLLPAEGPFAAYGYQPRPDQQRFLEHFHALRDGRFRVVSLFHLEGLITFPSFHTTWAVLLAWSFRHYRWLWLPMLVLNTAVVISTMTTGWHYASDVVGGILTAAAAVLITQGLSDWLAAGDTQAAPAVRPALQRT